MNRPTTRPRPGAGHRLLVAALFLLLAGCWAVAVPDPGWGVPAGVAAWVVALVLLGLDERRDKETDR